MPRPISARSRITRQMRLPEELDKRLVEAVKAKGIYLSDFIIRAIERELEREEGGKQDG